MSGTDNYLIKINVLVHYKRPGKKYTYYNFGKFVCTVLFGVFEKYYKNYSYKINKHPGNIINVLEGQIQKIIKRPVSNKGVRDGKKPQINKRPPDFN